MPSAMVAIGLSLLLRKIGEDWVMPETDQRPHRILKHLGGRCLACRNAQSETVGTGFNFLVNLRVSV